MGILVEGLPIAWEDMTDDIARLVRCLAVKQFLKHWIEWEARAESDPPRDLKWGEEIEYTLVRMDDTARSASLSCRAPEVLGALHYPPESVYSAYITWHPEYARWMVEGTPGQPYGNLSSDLLLVEQNMSLRRRAVLPALNFDEVMVSIPVFPLIGMPSALSPPLALPSSVRGPVMQSDYFPDSVINPHPRFPTLTANIRKRLGAKVCVASPVYLDVHTRAALLAADGVAAATAAAAQGGASACEDCGVTPAPPATALRCCECAAVFCPACDVRVHSGLRLAKHARSPLVSATGPGPKVPIVREGRGGGVEAVFDAMAFGMGTSCLQCTFQARDLKEARVLYDAFVPLAPLLLALSAGSPAYGGLLLDTDCRWNSIAASVDDRTPHERGECPHAAAGPAAAAATAADACCAAAHNGVRRLAKSRYASVSLYLGGGPGFRPEYNDVPVEVDDAALAALGAAGVDADLARHVAFLLVRDPLVVFKDRLGAAGDELAKGGAGAVADDVVAAAAAATGAEHFDNFNTSNWNSVRLKLPVSPPPAGAGGDAAAGGGIGWRVEFRPLEVQMSDFENAALVVFVTLLSRMVLTFGLTTYMPVSLVDANFARAHLRNAATSAHFYFRRKLLARDAACGGAVFDGLGGRARAFSVPRGCPPSCVSHCAGSADASCAFGLSPPCTPAPGGPTSCCGGAGGPPSCCGGAGGPTSCCGGAGCCRPGASGPQAGTGATGEEPVGAARWVEEVGEFTLGEIFCGGGTWQGPGLVALCHNYLDVVEVDGDARAVLNQYLDLIEGRASGRLATPAAWMRQFITKHPAYRGDSVVPQAAAYELVKQVCDIADGRVCVPELFGSDESALWPRGPSAPGYTGRRARIPDLPAAMSPPLAPVRHIGRPLTALPRACCSPRVSSLSPRSGRPAPVRSELMALLFPPVGSATPPLGFELSAVASQCLREACGFHPQLRTDEGSANTICNHAYMTLMSLAHLGAGDAVVAEWLSLSLFESVRHDGTLPPISAANWRAHLSCGVNGFHAYKTWFSSEIARVGRSCVLAGTVPLLLAGLMRGMFHPVIRLAHSLFDEPDASADALAYWCIRYQSMFPGAEECVAAFHTEAGPDGQDASLTAADVLNRIQGHFGPLAAALPAGTVLRHEHAENILARPNFRRFALLLTGAADAMFATALRLCLRIYRSDPSFHSLHFLTGLTALLLVSRAVPASRGAAARMAWLLACVNHFLHGFPAIVDDATAPLPAELPEGTAERWAALRAAAQGSQHVHIIKLVWSCTIIHHDVPDPAALEVCELAMRRGAPW